LLFASLLLACLADPGMPLPWLIWCALVPLFIAIERCSRIRQVLLFGLWGFGWWGWTVWWLVPAAIDFIGLAPWLAALLGLAIALSLSLSYWLIGLGWGWLQFENRWLTALLRALLFGLLSGTVPAVIPTALVSGSYVYPRLIQIVDIGGVPLLLTAVVLFNLLLAESLGRWLRADQPQQRTGSAAPLIAALAIPAALWSYGDARLALLDKLPVTSIDIGWVQPNLQRADSIDAVLGQTRQLVADYPEIDLVVWPEFPPAFSWSDNAADRERIDTLLQAIDKPLLLSSGYVFAAPADVRNSNGGPRPYYNSAQLISSSGALVGSHYKQRLVPFFEFLPFEQRWPVLRQFFPDSLSYVPGVDDQPIRFGGDIAIASLICYEMIFTELAQRQVGNGATIFINPGNDGWFGASRGSVSHMALAWFRTVEHHRPWLRVTNSGIGVAVSAGGEPLMPETSLQQRQAGHVRISVPAATSFYSKYPHAFLSFAGIAVSIGMAASLWRNRNLKTKGSHR
jgi:apolipoprotein N-acyltransferase